MTSIGRIAIGAGMLALIPLAGCSDSGSDDSSHNDKGSAAAQTVDAAFMSRAEKVCAPYARYNRTHPFRMTGFNRYAPTDNTLPRVAAFLNKNPSFRTLADELAALGTPKTGAVAWDAFGKDVADGQALVKREISRARAADADGFVRVSAQLEASQAALHGHLQKLGLSSKSTCYTAQGDPFRAPVPSE